MGWDTARFFPAFKRAGMLAQFSITSGTHNGVTLYGKLDATDEIEAQYGITMSDSILEYETAAAPSLKKGDRMQKDSVTYIVDEPPKLLGNGDFSVVGLNRNLP